MISSQLRRRLRRVGFFFALLAALAAVPVLAAEPPTPDTADVPLLPRALEARGDWIPDGETVREGIEAAQREEETRARELKQPEAVEERAASLDTYAEIDAADAEALLRSKFGKQLAALNSDPARRISRAEAIRALGGTAVRVVENGKRALLDAGVPVRTEDEAGRMQPLDVDLETTADGLETINAQSDVRIGGTAADPIEVGEEGVAITQVGIREASSTRRLSGQDAFQFETLTDTDTLISPTSFGVEIFDMLRSAKSPETLRFKVTMPKGAELRADGKGGALVVDGSKVIALIPAPTAVDAQGTDVPVGLTVEGDNLLLSVNHRDGDYAMPVLVDPIIEDWANGNWYSGYNINALENGAWQYASEPYGLIYFGTGNPCYYTCWGVRGLYLTAPSRNYGANVHSQWVYSAPNEGSYIEGAYIPYFWRDNHGCSPALYNEPHDYIGWVGNHGEWLVAPWLNQSMVGGVSLPGALGRAFVYGMGTGSSGVNIPCWRDVDIGAIAISLGDSQNPTIGTISGVPGGWTNGSTQFSVDVNSGDAGLGVHEVVLISDGQGVVGKDSVGNCTGLYASRCPTSHSSHFMSSGASLGEGVRSGSAVASDPLGKAAESSFVTKVDRSKPVVSLDGQLARATAADEGEEAGDEEVEKLSLPVYNLKIVATDEGTETDSEKRKRSGVKDIEVWLDSKQMPVPWEPTPSCPQSSCKREETYTLKLSEIETAGPHKLEVKVTDFVGNEKVRDIEFEYFPATGIKDEYLMHYFPLPDGQGDEDEEEHPRRPELAVNVMNGNLVYRQTDVHVESSAAVNLEVERYYNSMLPDSEGTEWGDGWTLSETPDLKPLGSGAPLAAVATMTQDPSLSQRYFSLWLDMPTPAGARAGYELKFKLVSTDTYDVTLSKWQAGSEVVLASGSGVSFADGDSLALVDEGAAVSAWTGTGSGFAELLSADDSSFEEGRAGIFGAGNIVRLVDFKAGELSSSPPSVGAELAALPVTEAFDGSEASSQRFQSEWSTLGWAGGGTPKGANTTIGWRPVDAFATAANGAFYNPGLFGAGEASEEAELLDASGAMESEVPLPTEAGQEEFDPELQATLKKKSSGGYLMTDETGESPTAVAFDSTGQTEALVTEGDAKVDYAYEGGALSEIAVKDPATFATEASEVEMVEPKPTEGTPLFDSAFGSLGSGDGEFDTPTDVAIGADGDLWVADYANNRIQHFNPAGEYVGQFGSQGSGDGELSNPASIALDAEGDLWVADKNNYRVQEFSPDGEYLGQFGSQGAEIGQFDRPEGIAVDASGDIWVSDTYNYRVQKFTPEGEFLEVVAPEGLGAIEPTGIDAGPDGKAWIADWSHNRVVAVSEDGDFELSFGSAGSGPGQFNRPDAIEADENGNVWVGDQGNGRLQRFDQEGEYVDQFGSNGSGEGQFSFSYPFGFAVGEDHRIWVADRNNHRIQHWDPPFEVSEEALLEDDDPSVEIDVANDLVASVSGEEAGEINYGHEGQLLTSVDGPEGETVYAYDEAERLTKITLANKTYAKIAYFADGRVEAVTVAPEGNEPKTTWFSYTDAPDRWTVVDPPDSPHITYDIGDDGSVLKWWNTAKPPVLELSGTLYDHKEEEDGIWPGDHELQAEAEDDEGISSIEIIAGGVLVEELHCEQVGGPPIECTEPEDLPWVMETEANPPGHMEVEVIATDSEGESTSERFWVDIPEPPPPPAPGTPVAPRFGEIKKFRADYGLEINFPVATQIELNERIFNLIKAWHEPNTPAGQVARASWERWGIPMRPQDVAELEYREWLYDVNAEKIDQWVEASSPSTYGGYYMDHPAGGIMRIGFLGDQSSQLASLETSLSLLGSGSTVGDSDRLSVYPTPPAVPYLAVKATSESALSAIKSSATLKELVVGVEFDESGVAVRVGTPSVSLVEGILREHLGLSAPIMVYHEAKEGTLLGGRFRNEGRMRAGDGIFTKHYSADFPAQHTGNLKCTAGFGAKRKPKHKPLELFVLTAGHCNQAASRRVYRSTSSDPLNEDSWKELGQVQHRAYSAVDESPTTDAEAIRVKQTGIVPQGIFGSDGDVVPTKPAATANKGDEVCFSGARLLGVSCGPIVGRTEFWTGAGDGLAHAGYWVKFRHPADHGDSGAPVYGVSGRSIGLVSAGSADGSKTLVQPLLTPRGMDETLVPGVLGNPRLRPLSLKLGD